MHVQSFPVDMVGEDIAIDAEGLELYSRVGQIGGSAAEDTNFFGAVLTRP